MLTVCGTLLLLFSVPVSGAYAWSVVGGSFFILSFVRLFGLGGFGWWCVRFPFSFDIISSCLVSLRLWLAVLMIMANWAVFGSNNSPMYFLYVVVFLIVSLVIRFSVSNFFRFYIFFEFSLVPTFFLILG